MPRNLTPDAIADFRDRLCDVAESRFAEHGPDAVTIRQLAADLGVSPMTPYRYFADKDAILAAVRARAFDRHARTLESAYETTPGDPQVRATALGEAYVRFALDYPHAYKLMFDIKQPSAGAYPDLIRAGERSRATMTRHVREMTDAGLIEGDPDLIGHLFWAALHGPLMLHYSGVLTSGIDAATLINGLCAALWRSIISSNPTPAATPG